MHIPDGFLSTRVWTTASILSGMALAGALARTQKKIEDRHIPFMGVMAAFVFAVQMINFPVGGGTSGHFTGSTLVALLLGPSAAAVIMSTVLIVQCLLFQDGGITALGANILNMALIGTFGGYAIYRGICILTGNRQTVSFIAAGIAAWSSVVLASLACALELALSGAVALKTVVPVMSIVHGVIGLAEGAITGLVMVSLGKVRSDLLKLQKI